MDAVAAIVRAPRSPFALEPVVIEEPRDDEILVRIHASGICHTDLAVQHGLAPFPLPAVLGHEGAGVVEKIGAAVTKVRPGDRVALTFRSCGTCRRCESHDPAYCMNMASLNYTGARPDGTTSVKQNGKAIASNFIGQSSFATYSIAYERNVVPIGDDVPFEIAAPLGCAVQTGVGAVLLALRCPHGSSLVIAGSGGVGLSAVMGAAIQGCAPIIVVEPLAARRDLALELGATHAVDPTDPAALRTVVERAAGGSVDFAIDTTGDAAMLNDLVSVLAPKGVLGVLGISPPGTPLPGDLYSFLVMGHSVRAILLGDSDPDIFLPHLMKFWREGRLPIEKLVKQFPFENIQTAIDEQLRGACAKAVLMM